MTVSEWKKEQSQIRRPSHTHFDKRISLDGCWKDISSPEYVKQYAFYPFIHYVQSSRKVKEGRAQESKKRQIYYAAHKDSWIYRYYAFLLNEKYNERTVEDAIDDVSIAYRNNHPGNSNISYAKRAFSFIRDHKSCFVMIGDFTDFFDNLSHPYLKDRLCDLLDVKRLPDDFYAVFKSITRFSYVELNTLMSRQGLDARVRKDRKKFDQDNERALLPGELRDTAKKIVKKNPKLCDNRGVPQGSPISAVLANIYMLEADKQIFEYISNLNGLYMRYSDDFIVIVPDVMRDDFIKCCAEIKHIITLAGGVELSDSKTRTFYCAGEAVLNCSAEMLTDQVNGKDVVEFLGFSYDGVKIRLRDKTISRYYNKLYRKANTIVHCNGITRKTKKKISGKNLYKLYSQKGSVYYRRGRGEEVAADYRERNFLDYVNSAKVKMGADFVDMITPRHMQRIRKVLKHLQQEEP